MTLFKNKTNKKLRIDSRTYIEAGETKDLDASNRHVQMYVAIRYLVNPDGSAHSRTLPGAEQYVAPSPVVEAPVVVVEAPVVEEAPVVAPTPVPEPAPVVVVEEAPVEEAPVEEAPEDKPRKGRKKKYDE